MMINSSMNFSISLFLLFFCIIHLLDKVRAQNQTNTSTDPAEARALNAVFRQWRISAQSNWNISGDPCTGVALDSTELGGTFNPGIKCDCTYVGGTICRIHTLYVFSLNVQGRIPDELWNLTLLVSLDLRQNVLTGPISASISNLFRMQYLSFGINSLSGQLPRELGSLTSLISLSFSSNNFSGPLPSELGNLVNLEQLYMDSSGVSGPIPPSFANLRSLTQVRASDVELTGRIPDFIGNWTGLTVLRFHGTALRGPIPLSFSNLTSLTTLVISDLSGSSSLDFIWGLRSLNILTLRNANISGSIPSNSSAYRSLSQLDLSFNSLSGEIPNSLFSGSLNFLFLGNNMLSGTLPPVKSSSLTNIDLSYNELSGSFPSWITERNLQINLVANNFSLDSGLNSSNMPSGLNCLQRNFPCGRDAPIYSDFAVKCGGPQIRSANQVLYENDNGALGPATYNVTSSRRWAVSNIGLFANSINPSYITSTSSQVTNTMNFELFQTSRISPSSLRYYGLGLENGNYTLTLQFAETQMVETRPIWQSLGRRVFDIYVQGNLVERDFNIRREAGDTSLRAVVRIFNNVRVTENYVEVHLFWAGKGTCCIPVRGTYGPSISSISASPEFIPTVFNNPPTTRRETNRTGLIVGIVVPLVLVTLVSLYFAYYILQKRKKRRALEDEEFFGIDTRPYTFSYAALRDATNDFSPENKLGEGGFGPVFKGTLEDGRVVAVKQLSVASHQGKSQFVAEIATISAVQHRNLVKLYGCCIASEKRLLVYEYLENKSLDQALFVGAGNINLDLNWATRFEICLGIARGLTYLHEESRLRIVHRDVKASNILLDSDLIPKISDFGLAKLYDDKKTHISTRVAGTIGYLAPEYAMRGHLTEKADVFGFGVVALEIVSGRTNSDPNLDGDRIYLLEWAWTLHENNQELELVDSNLKIFNEEEVKRIIGVALMCTQTSPNMRPSMSRVVAMLSGDIEVSSVATRPSYLTDWNFCDDTTSFTSVTPLTTITEKSQYSLSSNTTADFSPVSASQPMLSEILGDGR